jgi:TPR repeat protein
MNANIPHPPTVETGLRISWQRGAMKTAKWFIAIAALFMVPFVQPVFAQNTSSPVTKAKAEDAKVQNDANSRYYAEAFEWFTQAANQGQVEAQYRLGIMYYDGTAKVVPKNRENAMVWLKKAADQGHAEAQYKLSLMYPEDKAIELLTKSATQGSIFAQMDLGKRSYSGKGAPQDYKKASEWIAKAANQGNTPAHAVAQFDLGYMYEKGQGVPQNYEKAVEWYARAANNLLVHESGLLPESGKVSFSQQINAGATYTSRLKDGIIDLTPATGCAFIYVSKNPINSVLCNSGLTSSQMTRAQNMKNAIVKKMGTVNRGELFDGIISQ